MKIKTQFIASMAIFSVVLLLVTASIIITNQQISQLDKKQDIVANVEQGTNELITISSEYFLYQQTPLLEYWQSNVAAISGNLSNLKYTSLSQQNLVNTARRDLNELNSSFTNLVRFLGAAPRNVSVRVLPEFQNDWSDMITAHQNLSSDASHLANSLRIQTDQMRLTNIGLIITLLGVFSAFLLTMYLITYRRTLKSISRLQAEMKIIGSGNLDYNIKAESSDEISELSQSFNQMTTNLKTATVSKKDLEQEIIARKQAEVILRESRQRWETTLASIGDAVISTDTSGKILFMNSEAEKLTGWKLDEALLKPIKEIFKIVNEQTRLTVEDPASQVLEKGITVNLANHTLLIRKDETEIPIDDSGAPVKDKEGKTTGVVLIFRDISERKRIEKIYTKQATLIDLSLDAIIAKNPDETVTFWNMGAEKLYSYSKQEALGKKISILLKAQYPEPVDEIIAQLKQTKSWAGEITHFTKNNKEVIVQSFWLAKLDGNGEIEEILESNIDITERKKIEQQLSSSLKQSLQRESEISALLKASRAVLKYKEFQSSARAIFDVCKELIGATAGYVALLSDDGKENTVLFLDSGNLPCTVDPSLPMPIRGLRAEVYSSGKVAFENNFPQSVWKKYSPKGHVKLNNVLFAPLTIEKRTVGVIGLANKQGGFTKRDAEMAMAFGQLASVALINSQMLEMLEENQKTLKLHSERLETIVEERTRDLKHSERLAAIGATAGMVGHDIRNPLQAITSDIYLAKSELNDIPESEAKKNAIESLQEIEKNTDYINKIVADLQDFARPLNPLLEETDIKKIIDDLLQKNSLPENVKVSVKVADQARNVTADPTFITRIITNLMNNAVQAMPAGGKLIIKTLKKEDEVILTVRDTGEGIPDAVKSKLFTPMFTTKSKGQGFGLAVVKRMTEALGGTVAFKSKEGKGSTFIVHLPSNTRTK